MKQTLLIIAMGVSLWMPSVTAQDAESEVRTLIVQRDRDIKAAVRAMETDPSQREVARSLINDRIDFEEMGRLALGRYYEDLSSDERSDFVDTFGGIVRAQSLGDLSVYEAPVTIKVVTVTGEKASVSTTSRVREANLDVIYQLHRKDGVWWLYDIIIDDVGTVDGYSVSFQTFLRKRGFEAFMQSLRKRLASEEG